jgi:NTE family protein
MENTTSLVLSGGVALGAYQGGAYAAMHSRPELWPAHIIGSSIGAINGAFIAGLPPSARVPALKAFWRGAASDGLWPAAEWLGGVPGPFGLLYRWYLALHTRLYGCPGVMRPRTLDLMLGTAISLYDLAPMRARLERMVDFDRLNHGDIRFSVITTDIATGEAVLFDTGRGDHIGADHLIASCGFLPDFPPLEIGGRLLGDGGLAANAPLEAARHGNGNGERHPLCFVVDLYPREGGRPLTVQQAAARSQDLMFSNQTVRALHAYEREEGLRRLANGGGSSPRVIVVRYRGGPHEPGPHKRFDFSSAALAERWEAGRSDMAAAMPGQPGLQ